MSDPFYRTPRWRKLRTARLRINCGKCVVCGEHCDAGVGSQLARVSIADAANNRSTTFVVPRWERQPNVQFQQHHSDIRDEQARLGTKALEVFQGIGGSPG